MLKDGSYLSWILVEIFFEVRKAKQMIQAVIVGCMKE